MSARNRYKDHSSRRWQGKYLAVPHDVLNGLEYLGLSAHAVKLLFDIAAQYRGNNNGDLCAAWKLMRKRNWKSEETLNNAKKELIAAGLIAETRKGGFPNRTTLYGLTWFRLDRCDGKLDIAPAAFPFGGFARKDLRGIASRTESGKSGLNTSAEASNPE